jgi:hypothetical protein
MEIVPAIERRRSDRSDDVLTLLEDIKQEVTRLSTAFPANDADGHRRYHEAVIRRAEERADFYRRLRFELARWGLILFCGWLFVTMWQAFLKGPR